MVAGRISCCFFDVLIFLMLTFKKYTPKKLTGGFDCYLSAPALGSARSPLRSPVPCTQSSVLSPLKRALGSARAPGRTQELWPRLRSATGSVDRAKPRSLFRKSSPVPERSRGAFRPGTLTIDQKKYPLHHSPFSFRPSLLYLSKTIIHASCPNHSCVAD